MRRSARCRRFARCCGDGDAAAAGADRPQFRTPARHSFGSFGVTSVAPLGAGELHALSPGPFNLSYGVADQDPHIDVVIRWDHLISDAAPIAKARIRLNGEIATELAAKGSSRSQRPCRPWRLEGFWAVIPGGCEASNPESRDSGFGTTATPGMTP